MDSDNGSSLQLTESEMRTYGISTMIFSCVMICLCLLGLYGNVISMLIFSRPVMRRLSINILLSALSFIDFIIMILAAFVFVLPGLNEIYSFSFMPSFYPFIILIMYPMAMMAQTSSVWTFVLISVERYLAVCHPFGVQKHLTASKTKRAEIIIVVLSVLYNFVRFWEFQQTSDDASGGLVPLLRDVRMYLIVYNTFLYLLAHFFIPFFVILTLNILISRGVRRARNEERRMMKTGRSRSGTRRMVVIVTCMFGVCNFLSLIVNVWEACEPDLFSSSKWSVLAFTLLDISNVAVLFNCSTTFLVYLIYCRKYRRYFVYFHRCCASPAVRQQSEFLTEDDPRSLYFYRRASSMVRSSISLPSSAARQYPGYYKSLQINGSPL